MLILKQIIIPILSLAIIVSCHSSKTIPISNELVKLYPQAKNGQWGYSNENGELVICTL